jgi:hypothetical protein
VGTTPLSGSAYYQSSLPALTGVASDSLSGVARVELSLSRIKSGSTVTEHWNGSAWVVPSSSVPQPALTTTLDPVGGGASASWSRSSGLPSGSNLADGAYTLEATAFDRVGHTARATSSFTKATDATAPVISFTTATTTPPGTTPVPTSTIYNSMPAITGVAGDADSGVERVEVRLYRVVNTVTQYWNGSAWDTAVVGLSTVLNPGSGGANVTWSRGSGWPSGSDLPDGTYYLRALAYDRVSRSVATPVFSFKKATSATSAGSASMTSTESNVMLSTAEASVSSQSVNLTFSGALDQAVAQNTANYSISVNGQVVVAQGASYGTSTPTVMLLVPQGSLRVGSQVAVSWRLRDTAGAPVSGQITLQAQ